MSGGVPRDTDVEAVFQPKNLPMDIAPGLWSTGAMEGSVLVSNCSELDQEIEDGQVLGVVMTAAVRTTYEVQDVRLRRYLSVASISQK